jgi:hypothetical protein
MGKSTERSKIANHLLMVALAFVLSGCASTQILPFGAGPGMNSFLGVHFGEQKSDVMGKFPNATEQTSPYGADTIRLNNVNAGAVVYDYVLFEFLWRGGGMQLVMASFKPFYAKTVRHDLEAHLGSGQALTADRSDQHVRLFWHLSDGVQVIFNGADHILVIIGPRGKVLEQDIKAWQERVAESLPA